MIFTGEKQRTPREICPYATLSAINPTGTGLASNQSYSGKVLETSLLNR